MTHSLVSSLVREELADLHSYQPRLGSFEVRLDANEAPPLLSSDASAALARAMVADTCNRYPDPRAADLRVAIAERSGVGAEEILVGAGADEVISILLTALARPRRGASQPAIVIPTPVFPMYKKGAHARGYQVVEVPLDAASDLDTAAMIRTIARVRPNMVFIATPNNPTGNSMSLNRIEAVIAASPDSLVVLDEAYIDFATQKQIHLREVYPNVAVLRTMSKTGFAALRVGWVIASPVLIAELNKVRQPFNVTLTSQRAATFALQHLQAEVDAVVALIVAERKRVSSALEELGFDVTPSDANFVWMKVDRPAIEFAAALAGRGVLVRTFPNDDGTPGTHVRVTMGLPWENDRFLDEVDDIVTPARVKSAG